MKSDLPSRIGVAPFYANYEPRDGLIMNGDAPVMGVLDPQGQVIGIAWLSGSILGR